MTWRPSADQYILAFLVLVFGCAGDLLPFWLATFGLILTLGIDASLWRKP